MSLLTARATCLFGWIVIFVVNIVESVRIVNLAVPRLVQNGTTPSVVLDCIYSYTEEDQQLVVKWFFNQDPKPIYQWIPDLSKRAYSKSRVFDGHINRSYEATEDPNTKFRALNILRPSTEMSGNYSCSVTSLMGQDTRTQDMIVYAKPRIFDLSLLRADHSEETRFRCKIEGVFPEPLLHMYRMERTQIAGSEYMTVDNLTLVNYSVEPLGHQSMPSRDGYLTILTTSMPNRHLKLGPTKDTANTHQANIARRHLFFCVYTIPSTDIKQSRVLELYPEKYMLASSSVTAPTEHISISLSLCAMCLRYLIANLT
ncbi:uncharacterized protein LOC100900492 [Galendromus occidentalis]|uniref:Uncharacterized protein LOC100900492 n=1 Tax=Galendromus occidentalis TaxID=34638 RepID=A0AAJ7P9M3_9ACAR|nr:uncharacterized protein LOC100900492 [Galendromus occidentalis]